MPAAAWRPVRSMGTGLSRGAVQHQRRHLDAGELGPEVGLAERVHAPDQRAQARPHRLLPRPVEHRLRDLEGAGGGHVVEDVAQQAAGRSSRGPRAGSSSAPRRTPAARPAGCAVRARSRAPPSPRAPPSRRRVRRGATGSARSRRRPSRSRRASRRARPWPRSPARGRPRTCRSRSRPRAGWSGRSRAGRTRSRGSPPPRAPAPAGPSSPRRAARRGSGSRAAGAPVLHEQLGPVREREAAAGEAGRVLRAGAALSAAAAKLAAAEAARNVRRCCICLIPSSPVSDGPGVTRGIWAAGCAIPTTSRVGGSELPDEADVAGVRVARHEREQAAAFLRTSAFVADEGRSSRATSSAACLRSRSMRQRPPTKPSTSTLPTFRPGAGDGAVVGGRCARRSCVRRARRCRSRAGSAAAPVCLRRGAARAGGRTARGPSRRGRCAACVRSARTSPRSRGSPDQLCASRDARRPERREIAAAPARRATRSSRAVVPSHASAVAHAGRARPTARAAGPARAAAGCAGRIRATSRRGRGSAWRAGAPASRGGARPLVEQRASGRERGVAVESRSRSARTGCRRTGSAPGRRCSTGRSARQSPAVTRWMVERWSADADRASRRSAGAPGRRGRSPSIRVQSATYGSGGLCACRPTRCSTTCAAVRLVRASRNCRASSARFSARRSEDAGSHAACYRVARRVQWSRMDQGGVMLEALSADPAAPSAAPEFRRMEPFIGTWLLEGEQHDDGTRARRRPSRRWRRSSG